MSSYPYDLSRTVVIRAPRDLVFRYFTDSARWAAWWGKGSTIDGSVGGKVYVHHSVQSNATGRILSIDPPREIVFTLASEPGNQMGLSDSQVTIRLDEVADGTQLTLHHEFADETSRNLYIQGWRFQLSLFSNVVTNEAFAKAAEAIDAWFQAWSIADDGQRAAEFRAVVHEDVEFRDRYSLLKGLEDLNAHAGAALRFMPGVLLQRKGEVRQCQGTAICDWTVPDKDGSEMMAGTNVFTFGPDGKLALVEGFANSPR